MNKTPRTDEMLHLLCGIEAVKEVPSLVDLARQLESENAEMAELLERAQGLLATRSDNGVALWDEIDAILAKREG